MQSGRAVSVFSALQQLPQFLCQFRVFLLQTFQVFQASPYHLLIGFPVPYPQRLPVGLPVFLQLPQCSGIHMFQFLFDHIPAFFQFLSDGLPAQTGLSRQFIQVHLQPVQDLVFIHERKPSEGALLQCLRQMVRPGAWMV